LTPVLIDTDPGIDDALALLFAWSSPEIRVDTITTVAGNVPVTAANTNVARLLALRRPTPRPIVAPGAAGPLARALTTATRYHGEDGLGDLPDWPAVAPLNEAPGAVSVMVDAARRHGRELTLIALGPLTNVALALKENASAIGRVGRVVAMGGAVDVPGNEGARKRFGNLIASRFPVGRVMRHALPWPRTSAPSMPRAALEAVIQAPFGPLRVITTHLEYYSSGHRAAQIERLRELHAETNRENERSTASSHDAGPFAPLPHPDSAIVCGDFNLPPEDPLRARFLEAFLEDAPKFIDAWEALHPGKAHPHTFRVHERNDDESPYCCDYVFVTEDLVPRLRSISIDGDNRASDHQPVIVELA